MNKKNSALKKVLKCLGRYRAVFFISVILSALAVVLTLLLPVFLGDAIDAVHGIGDVDTPILIKYLIIAGVTASFTAVITLTVNLLNNRITYGITKDLRKASIRKIEKLPLSYLDSHTVGDVLSRVMTDTDQVTDGLLMGITQLIGGVLTVVGTVGFMIAIDWKIALAVIVLTPLSLLLAKFIATRTYSMFSLQSKTRGEQTGFIEETIENQKVVRAFSLEKENIEKFDEINERLRSASLRATFFSSLVNPTTRVINNIVYAVVILIGALTVLFSDALTVGALSALLAFSTQYAKPFNEISGIVTELQNALSCAERVFEFLDEEEETPDAKNELTAVSGDVRLNNITFSYVPDKELIRDLSLDIKSGMRVAIVGPTGCGKTTLINLLMRFYDPLSGNITVDGNDIKNVTRHSLRESFGMVLQDTWIRHGTVRDNIAIGKPDATDEEIVQAAKAAHADGFIRRLPEGYDTVISPDANLSQGERQLLCISRLMLLYPPMLILDEATSSIDTRTEIKIQDAFSKMTEGKTSFTVAHRLSTIKNADLILVMKDGTVIESGTHTELLNKNGFYKELYNSQFAKV